MVERHYLARRASYASGHGSVASEVSSSLLYTTGSPLMCCNMAVSKQGRERNVRECRD
jgi:hypothetical protein